MDMKYIISEEQLRLITEQESEENKGRMIYITVKMLKPPAVIKNTNTDSHKIKYTPEGYPIPTKPFRGYWMSLSTHYGRDILYSKLENPNPQDIIISGYEGPDGEAYVYNKGPDNEQSLVHLNKSLIDHVVDAPHSEEDAKSYIKLLYPIFKSGKREKVILSYYDENRDKVYEKEID